MMAVTQKISHTHTSKQTSNTRIHTEDPVQIWKYLELHLKENFGEVSSINIHKYRQRHKSTELQGKLSQLSADRKTRRKSFTEFYGKEILLHLFLLATKRFAVKHPSPVVWQITVWDRCPPSFEVKTSPPAVNGRRRQPSAARLKRRPCSFFESRTVDMLEHKKISRQRSHSYWCWHYTPALRRSGDFSNCQTCGYRMGLSWTWSPMRDVAFVSKWKDASSLIST